jgi:hypothetical protein
VEAYTHCCFFYFSIENIFKSPQRNWWDFLLKTLHSIVNEFNVERQALLAKQVPKLFSGSIKPKEDQQGSSSTCILFI